MDDTIATRKQTKHESKGDVGNHGDAGRFEHGQANAHRLNDRDDGYSVENRAALEQKLEREEGKNTDAPSNAWWDEGKPRPTQIAESHGNKPSKGAIIDEQIQNEEYEELKKKGKI
jgi:hypothetical protein